MKMGSVQRLVCFVVCSTYFYDILSAQNTPLFSAIGVATGLLGSYPRLTNSTGILGFKPFSIVEHITDTIAQGAGGALAPITAVGTIWRNSTDALLDRLPYLPFVSEFYSTAQKTTTTALNRVTGGLFGRQAGYETADDFIRQLEAAIESASSMSSALTLAKSVSTVPPAVFASQAPPLTASSKAPVSLVAYGVGGPTRFVEYHQQKCHEVAETLGIRGTAEACAVVEPFNLALIDQLIETSKSLLVQLDALLITVSKGARSTLSSAVARLTETIKGIVDTPENAAVWASLVATLETIKENLEKMPLVWQVSQVAQGTIQQAQQLIQGILDKLFQQEIPLVPEFFTSILKELETVIKKIFSLNGTVLSLLPASVGTQNSTTLPADTAVALEIPLVSDIYELIEKSSKRLATYGNFVLNRPVFTMDSIEKRKVFEELVKLGVDLMDIKFVVGAAQRFIFESPGLAVGGVSDIFSFMENLLQSFTKMFTLRAADQTLSVFTELFAQLVAVIYGPKSIVLPRKQAAYQTTPQFSQKPSTRRLAGTFDHPSGEMTPDDWELLQKQKDYLTVRLPLLKSELELFESLRTSECDYLKQLLTTKEYGSMFVHEVAQVCDDIKFVGFVYDFQDLTKAYLQLMSSIPDSKVKYVQETVEAAIAKFIKALETEKVIAQHRAELAQKSEQILSESYKYAVKV